MSAHTWIFAARFRRNAFGWRSDKPILRIKEAISEIKQIARKDPVLAAAGAISLLEKLSPALEAVDSSSGAIGSAVNRAIDTLVPIIAKADVNQAARQQWLERLWDAIQNDGMSYIEGLGESWGELCASREIASTWADELLPFVEQIWSSKDSGPGFYQGTTLCLSSLFAAGRHEELLRLLEKAPHKWWHNRRWGAKALAAMGRKAEALRYAEASRGLNEPDWQISQDCEAILLSSGMIDEAYNRYALQANQGTSNLATFRAIAKKYPHKKFEDILSDLIASQPGAEGKWFAAAKEAGLYDLAIELVARSPADPRTLTRAAKDYAVERPQFAVDAGMAALRWISLGHGYEITSLDVLDAYTAVIQAATGAGMDEHRVRAQIQELIASPEPNKQFMRTALANTLLT